MKIAIDVHGTIDWDPAFWRQAILLFIAMGHQVHIMSGPSAEKIMNRLKNLNIDPRDLYIESMTDYLKENHAKDIYYDERGHIWTDDEIWWKIKATLCTQLKIDVLIDDHYEYYQYDLMPYTKFLLYQKGRFV